MVQAIGAFFFVVVHQVKAKFWIAFGAFADLDGEGAAEIVFDIGGFIAGFPGIPSINAERGEIAGLAFRAVSAGNEILRVVALGISDAVEFEPGEGAHVGGVGAFSNSIGDIEGDESGNDPAGDGNGLIAGLRCGGNGRIAHDAFAGRTSGDTTNEEPIFFPGDIGVFGSFFLVGDLHPIGDGTAEDFKFSATAELVEARFGASRRNAKIGGGFGAAASLDRQDFGLFEELSAALPKFRLHQITAINPSGEAGSGANFYVVVAASEDFDAVAVEKHTKLLAHLSDATPESDAAFADISLAE